MKILYLDIDTLRPDHLGCYGYHRNTSPNIDRIAAEGVRFDNYYVSDAPCLPSRTAMMTGQFGIHTGVVEHGGTCADPRFEGPSRHFKDRLQFQSLPGFLNRQANLHTCYIGGFGARHGAWNYYAGFREIHDTGKGGHESAEEVTPFALDWIEQNAEKESWYLHVNYWDPHGPFRAPAEFGNPFENDPLPEHINQELIDRDINRPSHHTLQDLIGYGDKESPDFPRQPGKATNMKEMKKLIDGYDCGIRYADEHVGILLNALEKKGVLDELVIIVSADHGENYGELGLYGEHATADQGTCRIPMIIRWPGKAEAGQVDNGLHYNLDLIPTLADILEKEPREEWEGQSYAASLTDGADTGRNFLVLSQCAHGAQRSVRWGDWLYIRTFHDGYHCWDEEMLFNLKNDPCESNNLLTEQPEEAENGRLLYKQWHREMMDTMPYGHTEDPMETVLMEIPFHCKDTDMNDYCKRLEATGRGQWIPMIKERHPEMFTE